VLDPDTELFEIVELPHDLEPKDIEAVGISESGGAYVVETKHRATDRHGEPDAGSDLEL